VIPAAGLWRELETLEAHRDELDPDRLQELCQMACLVCALVQGDSRIDDRLLESLDPTMVVSHQLCKRLCADREGEARASLDTGGPAVQALVQRLHHHGPRVHSHREGLLPW
jgi:hypothetical protein